MNTGLLAAFSGGFLGDVKDECSFKLPVISDEERIKVKGQKIRRKSRKNKLIEKKRKRKKKNMEKVN